MPGSIGAPSDVVITRQVQEKPLFAQLNVLSAIHRQLITAVQKRRPTWRVTSTSGIPAISGELHLVRTVIKGNELLESDRPLKQLAFGFGFLIPPLEILAAFPVQETQRVFGTIERFVLQADAAKNRLVRFPSQPDYAVSITDVVPLHRPFGLDVSYEEGLLANELPRTGVLISGFVDRLANAVVAIVEERGDALPTPSEPP
jgi:hypothetical protein